MMARMLPRTSIPISNKEIAATIEGLLQGENGNRAEVAKFENELATYLGVPKVLALNSGRTALYTALESLGMKSGDEVIVPAYTCAIVFEVILRLGLKPVLVDVDPKTYNIDSRLISEAITSKTKAIVPIHLFGRPCEMTELIDIAEKNNLYLIEDAAQALGAEYKGTKVGTLSDLAIFSFGPGKSMTTGEGGAIAVKNEELIEKVTATHTKLVNPSIGWVFHLVRNVVAMRIFSNPHLYGLARGYLEKELDETDSQIVENCLNLTNQRDKVNLHRTVTLTKMPSFSAKIGRIQLKKLDEFNKKRIANAMTLTSRLKDFDSFIQLPEINKDVKNTFTRYPIRVLNGSRDNLLKRLKEWGIDGEKPYHYLTSLFETWAVNAPNAYNVATSIFTIPNHPLLKESDVLRIANTLSDMLSK